METSKIYLPFTHNDSKSNTLQIRTDLAIPVWSLSWNFLTHLNWRKCCIPQDKLIFESGYSILRQHSSFLSSQTNFYRWHLSSSLSTSFHLSSISGFWWWNIEKSVVKYGYSRSRNEHSWLIPDWKLIWKTEKLIWFKYKIVIKSRIKNHHKKKLRIGNNHKLIFIGSQPQHFQIISLFIVWTL